MEMELVPLYVGIGVIINEIVDRQESQAYRLEHPESLFLDHIERTLDALVGERVDVLVADPGGKREQQHRQHQCESHHDAK
jgi:hypothetical protein